MRTLLTRTNEDEAAVGMPNYELGDKMLITTGSVVLKEQLQTPSGRWVHRIAGRVSVMHGERAVGFTLITENNANWLVEVCGSTECVYVPGCQVHAIHQHNLREDSDVITWVLE